MTKKDSRPVTESILIVGATGNIGSELLNQLAGAGHRARALVRDRISSRRRVIPLVTIMVKASTRDALRHLTSTGQFCVPRGSWRSLPSYGLRS